MSEIVTKEDVQIVGFLDSLDRMLDGLETLVENYKPPLNGETYLTDKEVSERLKISRRTLQSGATQARLNISNWRVNICRVCYPTATRQTPKGRGRVICS